MKFVINLILLIIIALCVRRGFKRGLIGSIIMLIVMMGSLIIANVLATTFSKEIVPALKPFIGGFIDSETTTDTVLDRLGFKDSDLSLNDILEKDGSLRYDYAYETMREVGFYKDISEELADDAVKYSENTNTSMTESVIVVVSNTVSFVGCVTIAFIMVLILLSALIDMLNLDIKLPGLDIVDEISGAAMGLIIGFLYCVLICWVLGFAGILIGKETADRDALVRFFLAFRFITRTLI